jgi:hypothetical protein
MNIKMKTFKIFKKGIYLIIALLAFFTACSDKEEPIDSVIDHSYKPVKVTPVSGMRIAWDYSSLSQIATAGNSPKMIRLNDSKLATLFESEGVIYWTVSQDNGTTWSQPSVLFPLASHQGMDGEQKITYQHLMTQPTIIMLDNGELLAACAVRYKYILTNLDPDVIVEFPAAIITRRITNNGTVLGPIKEVYNNLGCENPELLKLPNGDTQLYFTNGSEYISLKMMSSTALSPTVKEQRIELITSTDYGNTWSSKLKEFGPDGVDSHWDGAKVIASRSNRHNNSPSAEIVGEDIVVAIGDNRNVTFKPFILRSPISSNWPYTINGDTPERSYAFYAILPEKYFMGNPYLLAVSNDESLLAYDTDAGRNKDMQTMEVTTSKSKAENFTNANRPFPFPADVKAIRSSLMKFDESTVVALTSSNYKSVDKIKISPWSIKGHLFNDLLIQNSEISDYPLFIGGLSESNVKIGLGVDATNLYVSAKATDATPITAASGTQKGDGIYLYIDAPNLSLLDIDTGISKFWISAEGEVARWDGKEGQWKSAASGGIIVTTEPSENGYTLSITIPKAKLSNFNNKGIRFGAAFSDYSDIDISTLEFLPHCSDLRSSTWLGINF